MRIKLAKSAFFSSFCPPFAMANDSGAELAAGGIEFKKIPEISMESEDLTISLKKVSVSVDKIYFANRK